MVDWFSPSHDQSHEFHLTAGAFGGKNQERLECILYMQDSYIWVVLYATNVSSVSQAKGRVRFEQTGSVKDLDKFSIALGYTGDGHLTH